MSLMNASVPGYLVLGVVLLSVVGTAAATSVVVTNDGPDPITGVEGDLQASGNLTVETQTLQYEGTNVSAVNITVNNTASTSVSGNIYVAIYDDTDSLLVSKTRTGVSFPGGKTSTHNVTLSSNPYIGDVVRVEATIEETSS
ncbi:hypothetical protein [Haloparvum sp. PAK95]|uniref:hypothetical protein n=1 Tax=Haloparvum sp. PAK95 TaxID=3418962 RepID=UPI003D2F4947